MTLTGAAPVTTLDPTAVLLDLDGTITDSAPPITSCIARTLADFGYPVPPPEDMLRFVGPPIRDGLTTFGGVRPEELDDVVRHYRSLYAGRMLDAPLYPGIAELIKDLHAAGTPIALATSKVQRMAAQILDDAGLAEYFTVICGASPDEKRSVKADIVEDAIAGLRAAGADVSRAVHVGDRHHDVTGALEHGLRVVLVTWGYGAPDEAEEATAVARDVTELRTLLGATPR